MSRVLEIKRKEGVIGCRAYYRVYIDEKLMGKIANGQVFRCEIPSDRVCFLQIKETFSLRSTGSDRTAIEKSDDNVSFLLTPNYSYLGGTRFELVRRPFLQGIDINVDDVSFEKNAIVYMYNDQRYRLKLSKACKLWRFYHYGEKKKNCACDKKYDGIQYNFWFYEDTILKISADENGAKYFEKALNEHGVEYHEFT